MGMYFVYFTDLGWCYHIDDRIVGWNKSCGFSATLPFIVSEFLEVTGLSFEEFILNLEHQELLTPYMGDKGE